MLAAARRPQYIGCAAGLTSPLTVPVRPPPGLPGVPPLDRASLARIEAHLPANTDSTVTAVSGTLPARLEVAFTAAVAAHASAPVGVFDVHEG